MATYICKHELMDNQDQSDIKEIALLIGLQCSFTEQGKQDIQRSMNHTMNI